VNLRRHLQNLGLRLRSAGAVRWLTVLSLSISVGMLVFGGAILVDMKNDALTEAAQASDNLATALARDIARNIKQYDLSVQGAISAWDRADIRQISPETAQMALFDSAAKADYLGSLSISDPLGVVVASSLGSLAIGSSLANRDYFRVQQERVDAELYLSRPFISDVRKGDPSIAISRRIFGHDGQFGGIVVGTVRLAFFQHLFEQLDLGSHGTVTLFRTDGRLIMRSPLSEGDIDRDLSGSPVFHRFLVSPVGNFVDTAVIDGVQRLFSYRWIGDLPLILSVATSTVDIYAQWQRKAVAIGLTLFMLCGAALVLMVLFRRELSNRIAAEQQLAILASTDALTGVANRRSFEETFCGEWKRAARAEMPLALLMLDVDFFKTFNDTYGHPAGDRVLRAIADAIVAEIRRPGDVAARYGGEEFVALLPETEAAGARDVATRICAAVADLDVPHAGSLFGYVTISIGVAVSWPTLGAPMAVLVKAADEALYQAKRSGRNRVGGQVLEMSFTGSARTANTKS
jgi:diguanylate cyclase (GGDEF)-like protein